MHLALGYVHIKSYTSRLQGSLLGAHNKTYASTTASSSGLTGPTPTLLFAATTRHPVARALRQPSRAPRLLVTRPHRLYVNLVVHRKYSSPGRSGSTSTTPYAATTSLLSVQLPRLLTSTSLNQKTSRGRLPRHQQLVRIHLQLVDFSPNRRGSIIDRHGFVDTRPRIKLSHLFQ
jgi:hypothetical protein